MESSSMMRRENVTIPLQCESGVGTLSTLRYPRAACMLFGVAALDPPRSQTPAATSQPLLCSPPLDCLPFAPQEDPPAPAQDFQRLQHEDTALQIDELGEMRRKLEGPREAQHQVDEDSRLVDRRREESVVPLVSTTEVARRLAGVRGVRMSQRRPKQRGRRCIAATTATAGIIIAIEPLVVAPTPRRRPRTEPSTMHRLRCRDIAMRRPSLMLLLPCGRGPRLWLEDLEAPVVCHVPPEGEERVDKDGEEPERPG